MRKMILISVIIVLMTSCYSNYVIEKSHECVIMDNKNFSLIEIERLDQSLGDILKSSKYKLEGEGSHLELRTRSKKIRAIENSINKPIILFKKIEDVTNKRLSGVLKILRTYEGFKLITEEDLRYRSSVLGYVADEEELIKINGELEFQNYDLTQLGLYWTSNSKIINLKKSKGYYLIATSDMDFEIRPNLLDKVEGMVDYENFEPSIKLFLNDCGLNKFKNDFRNGLNTVILNDKIISIQQIRIRNENEVSIFGFKTLEEAKLEAVKIREMGVEIRIK